MFQTFEVLENKQKKKYFLLCILFLISMMLELLGISALIPLISFLQNPEQGNFLSSIDLLIHHAVKITKIGLIISEG